MRLVVDRPTLSEVEALVHLAPILLLPMHSVGLLAARVVFLAKAALAALLLATHRHLIHPL